jgi:hypothetical protein
VLGSSTPFVLNNFEMELLFIIPNFIRMDKRESRLQHPAGSANTASLACLANQLHRESVGHFMDYPRGLPTYLLLV